ncbi:hypothetical protein CD351_08075 [Erythrobacter sp. KY5]|uniref:hypothetical protein n=1 Tax=Erythrobacter sp. KY5 TaxID=2011159 RepID=UPI000DBF2928|nr:hypothetical protein [Erythrobacter sp. KY5]AWW74381.1 hypothetical protein CD351_08075 [Erythrobacter sp. KY5]
MTDLLGYLFASNLDRPACEGDCMTTTRRTFLAGSLATLVAAHPLIGCSAASTATKVHVMGVIHARHRRSERYSLAVLEKAIRKAAPDVILTEIPPDRIGRAISSFEATGKVEEPRTQVFPEYTDVVFPLRREMKFRLFGCAGWTRKIADERAHELDLIENDPARARQWAEHRAAQSKFARLVSGHSDDPRFIHTESFDQLVEKSREPYHQHFDAVLGAGGWTQINKAHTDLINLALDQISGEGLTALIMFGSAHKYMIRRSLSQRGDINLLDTTDLFA